MFLTFNLESTGQSGDLSTQCSCARCKAGAASQRRANFSTGMSFALAKHGDDIVNLIHHSLHIFHSIVIKITLLVSENIEDISQTLKNRSKWSRSMPGGPINGFRSFFIFFLSSSEKASSHLYRISTASIPLRNYVILWSLCGIHPEAVCAEFSWYS